MKLGRLIKMKEMERVAVRMTAGHRQIDIGWQFVRMEAGYKDRSAY